MLEKTRFLLLCLFFSLFSGSLFAEEPGERFFVVGVIIRAPQSSVVVLHDNKKSQNLVLKSGDIIPDCTDCLLTVNDDDQVQVHKGDEWFLLGYMNKPASTLTSNSSSRDDDSSKVETATEDFDLSAWVESVEDSPEKEPLKSEVHKVKKHETYPPPAKVATEPSED